MSINTAVKGSLKKLTDKGEGGVTDHHIEVMDDGTFLHRVTRKKNGNSKMDYPQTEAERHTHSSVGKLCSCLKETHSGVVEAESK